MRFRVNSLSTLLIVAATISVNCGGHAPNTTTNKAANNVENTVDSPTHSQNVSINSPDGVVLVGTYYESEKPNTPAILLLHQWQSDRHSWDDFATRINARGFAVLSIDGRGFGESTKKADGSSVAADRTDKAVKGMLGDVGAAFDYLTRQNNVDPNRIGIVGASYGSSLAIMYAADNPKVAAVALLSPGLNYFGNMQTEPAVKKYGDRPLLLIAASDDPDSAEAVNTLGSGSSVYRSEKVYPRGGHGTALFELNERPGLADTLQSFFVSNFRVPEID